LDGGLGSELCIVENYLFMLYMSVIHCKIHILHIYNYIYTVHYAMQPEKKNVTLQTGYTLLSVSSVHRSHTLRRRPHALSRLVADLHPASYSFQYLQMHGCSFVCARHCIRVTLQVDTASEPALLTHF